MAPPSSGEENNAPAANLQVDTSAAEALASASSSEQQQQPLTSPAEATEFTEMSTMRELRVAGAFSADQTETTADNSSFSYGTAPPVNAPVGAQQLQQQYQYGGTPTSAALAPSSASIAMPQQQQQQHMPQQQQPQPQQWTVEENGVKVQVTSHQATDGTMTLTLPSGAVVTLQAAPQPQPQPQSSAQAQAAQMQMPMQQQQQQPAPCPPSGAQSTAEHSMGFLPLGTFQGNHTGSSGGGDPAQQPLPPGGGSDSNNDAANTTNSVDMRVPFVPSLNTTASGGNMTTATTDFADDSVQYIDPLSSRIQVGGDGGDHEEGKVSAESINSSNNDDEIPPALSNVDSADAAAGDGSPQKRTKAQSQPQQHGGQQQHRRTTSSTSRSLGSQTIDGEQVTVLRAHALPNSSVIISSREGSVVEEQHDVEVLHQTLSVSSSTNTNTNSNGSKSLGSGSKLSSSSDPDLAAGGGGAPPADSEFARKGESSAEDIITKEAAKIEAATTDEASEATPQTKLAAAAPPKTEEEYKPLWLKAREEGREEEAPQSDPSKVYFVMNKQSNRKTEYYVSSGKDLPGLPHKDSAETDKPPSQIAMEENLRRAQKEAAEAAAIQQQQLEELAYLREMQRRHAELEGQYIYHDDDMTEVSELTMGVHEMGIGPSIAHTDANANANTDAAATGDIDDVPDVVQSGSYTQSVDWNNLTEEQKKQISSDMASRNGGAVGLPDNEQLVETMVNMFTPELCHKAEPTKKLVRGLGALQPIHSTRSINMYQHKRSGRGRGGRGGYYRPAAAAASSAQLPSINDVEYPSSPKSNGPTSSGGSTGDANSTTSSQRKIAKPISPLKSLKSVRGLHGGIN